MTLRRLLPSAALLLVMMSGAAPDANAAPQTKRCIESAESGQQLRSSGKLMEARKSFALCTAPTCPNAVRRDCAKWIEEVDAALPTVAVRLEDDQGHEVPDGKVVLDDDTPIQPSAGRSVPVDPGAHRFTWQRADGKIEQEVVIREGEHNRAIVLRVAGGVTSPPVLPERPPPPPPPRSSALPLLLGGIGLASIGVGGAFWFAGLRERSNLEQTCKDAHTCAQGDIDASRAKLIVGDVLAGVGIVALAAAIYLVISQPGEPPRAAAAR